MRINVPKPLARHPGWRVPAALALAAATLGGAALAISGGPAPLNQATTVGYAPTDSPSGYAPTIGPSGSPQVRQTSALWLNGGDEATTWSTATGVEATIAGPPGSTVSVHVGRNSAQASLLPSSGAAAMNPRQYAASGRSVYWDALGAGASKAEAATMTLADGDPLPPGVSLPAGVHPLGLGARHGQTYNSVCAYVRNKARTVGGAACLQQSYLQQQPGSWYVENQITSTGQVTGGNTILTQLNGSYCYCNRSTYTRVAWKPSSTIGVGTPTNYTFTISADGFTASVQEILYPGHLSPYFPDGLSNPAFGSRWTGHSEGDYVDANSVAIVHNGRGATNLAGVTVGIGWYGPA